MATKKAVAAFRSEVDALREVIRKTVNEEIRKLGSGREIRVEGTDLSGLEERIDASVMESKSIWDEIRALKKEKSKSSGNAVEKGVEDAVENVVESKVGAMNNKITMLKREVEMLRGELESSKTKKLEEELHRNVSSLKSEIKKLSVENQALGEKLEAGLHGMKVPVPREGQGREMNMPDLMRDLEIIKTKQEWIENNIERIDIKPIIRKMEELEHRIRVIGISSPLVIE